MEIRFVYTILTSEEKQQIIQMWMNAAVLPYNEALRRVNEVSVIIVHDNEIVGVSTVYPALLSDNNPYFFFRMFIVPEHRGDNGLRTQLMRLNFDRLKALFSTQIKGIALELENTKLIRLGNKTDYMSKRGYTYYGQSARDLPLWFVDFETPKGIFLCR